MRNAELGIRKLVHSADGIVRRFRNPQSAIRNGIRVLLILCMMSLVACGYQMVGKETHVPPGLSSIAIPTFKNKTFEPGIEIPFTQAFLNEFILDRRVKVTGRAEADSILEGTVTSFTAYPATFDASGFVLQYVMTVTIYLSIKDRAGKVLWANNASQTGWFQGSSAGPTNEAAKQVAIQNAAASMANSVRTAFFSNF